MRWVYGGRGDGGAWRTETSRKDKAAGPRALRGRPTPSPVVSVALGPGFAARAQPVSRAWPPCGCRPPALAPGAAGALRTPAQALRTRLGQSGTGRPCRRSARPPSSLSVTPEEMSRDPRSRPAHGRGSGTLRPRQGQTTAARGYICPQVPQEGRSGRPHILLSPWGRLSQTRYSVTSGVTGHGSHGLFCQHWHLWTSFA